MATLEIDLTLLDWKKVDKVGPCFLILCCFWKLDKRA